MDLEDAAADTVIREGFLEKEGHLVKNWKKRMFVLTSSTLRYYERSARQKPKGEVDLSTVLKVIPPARGQTLFEIRTISGKDFRMRAENSLEAAAWARDIHGIHVAPGPIAQFQMQVQQASEDDRLGDEDKEAILEIVATGDPDDLAAARAEFRRAVERHEALLRSRPVDDGDAKSDEVDGVERAVPGEITTEYSTTALPPIDEGAFLGQSTLFNDDYTLGKHLGEGGYSTVHEATHKASGQVYAVKVIEKSRLDAAGLRALKNEVHVMSQLNHPNIVQMEAFYNESTTFYLVCELMSGGELFDQIVQRTHYSEREARDVVVTLASALAYMHGKNIAHRDLKPENILLSSSDERTAQIKLADLGFARVDPVLKTRCGTPSYVAPEILEGRVYHVNVDVWGLGVITYILLCGYAPFASKNQARLFQLIKEGRFFFDSPYWDSISDTAKSLIRRMLEVDPSRRISTADILKDPWVVGTVGDADLSGVQGKMKDFRNEAREVVKEGFLTKRGGLIKSWKRRLFRLTGQFLSYQVSEDTPVKGTIRLRQIRLVQSSKDDETQFVVRTSVGRDFLIQASSIEEKKDWMKAITTTLQRQDLMVKAHYAMGAPGGVENAKELMGLSDGWKDLRTSVASSSPTGAGAAAGAGGGSA